MGTRIRLHRRSGWALVWLPPALLVVLLASGISPWHTRAAEAAPAAGCNAPIAGKHIYDCAGILTPPQIVYLEGQAAAVAQAGAPTVVYLQMHAATAQETLQDAAELMNRWEVESHPGAHDGFVMFFNVQPGNTRHGEVALYAGAKYVKNGTLPQSELDRIRMDVMTPLLQQGQIIQGIAAGLHAVAQDLSAGTAPLPAGQQVVAFVGRIPLNLLALLFAALVALLCLRLPRLSAPTGESSEVGGLSKVASPGDLPPAMAGALVTGRINDAQLEGTILDFGRRGLLELEPLGATVQVQLRGGSRHSAPALIGYEREMWESLVTLAGSDHGTIAADQLAYLRKDLGKIRSELQRELTQRGWFDPVSAASRRWPFYILGRVGGVAVILSLLVMVASNEGWAGIGLTLFLGAGAVAFIRGYAIPDTTAEGEQAAEPWRAYLAQVTALEYDPHLDADLPYIVALGVADKLAPRLRVASEKGYSPSWFRGEAIQSGQVGLGLGFYPYWLVLHGGALPTTGGFSGGSFGGGGFGGGGFGGGGFGGGAAAGGGGSAGGY